MLHFMQQNPDCLWVSYPILVKHNKMYQCITVVLHCHTCHKGQMESYRKIRSRIEDTYFGVCLVLFECAAMVTAAHVAKDA